jgi:hypothetical protein
MRDMSSSEVARLFGAVHDQIATEEEFAELDQWLRDNPQGQSRYIEFMDTQHEVERQLAAVPVSGLSDSVSVTRTQIPRSRLAKVLAMAASLLIVLGVSWLLIAKPKDSFVAENEANSKLSRVLGIVTKTSSAVSFYDGEQLGPGSAVRAGKLQLSSGKIRLRLESGVELSLSGQTEIDLKNGQLVELLSGSVTADVPDSVIGFSVEAPGLNVFDLGTTFGVSLSPSGQPSVHVFDGVVDAEVQGSSKRTRLTGKQTAAFDGTSVIRTDFQDSMFTEPELDEFSTPITTGDVRFLHTPPSTVESGQFEHDLVLCFRERNEPVILKEPLPLSLDAPGHYRVRPKWKNFGRIPSGTLVDSYFVHLDAVGPEKRLREGTITFDRPILGVVFSSQLLSEQNRILGSPSTSYSSERTNPKHDPTLENETVTLSADRRTIRFSWIIRSRSDQARVIVAADGG